MLERIKKTKVPLQFRNRTLFDADWKFHLGDEADAWKEAFADGQWRVLTVPHDWSIEGKFDRQAPTGGAGGYLPAGIGWYRKTFEQKPEEMGKRVFLEFDGVMQNSTVFVNGNCVGNRPYGYASFCYDITEFVKEGINVVAVKVDNSHQPCSRWYAGAGIYRHVYLTRTAQAYVPYSGVQVTTPEVSAESAVVQVQTEVCSHYLEDRVITLDTEIVDPEGNIVVSGSEQRCIKTGQTAVFCQRLLVQQPQRWSLETPVIYRVHSVVSCDGEKLDDTGTSFGIRKFGYSQTEGFTVNGEKVFIKGLCMHQQMGCTGIAIPERLMEENLLKLKAAGCNGIRLSHYPYSPEMMDLLDTIGFIVLGEAFDEWARCRPKTADAGTDGLDGESVYGYSEYFEEWNVQDLTDYLRRDRNHPSVAFWSIGNEVPEQNYPEGAPMARKMIERVHKLDPTRPVTSACCNTSGLDKVTTTDAYLEALDIIGVNYVDQWGDNVETYYFQLHERFPDKIILGNEHVSAGGIRGKFDVHEHANRWYTTYYNKMIDIEQRHKFLTMHPYVLGDYMWTALDYLGEESWPAITPGTGVMDTCGFEKDGFLHLRSIWQDKTVLDIVPHWNYEGHEGEAIPVVCFTNCEYVELFVNGQSYGKQSWQFPRPSFAGLFNQFIKPRLEITTSDLHLTWHVPYQPGQIKAVGYRNGEVAATCIVNTAGTPAKLKLTATSDRICADGQDACKIAVRIEDGEGNLAPRASDRVKISVSGAGELLGVDNGSPFVGEGYREESKEAFNGMMCAVIRSNGQKGEICVTAQTEFDTRTICILAE